MLTRWCFSTSAGYQLFSELAFLCCPLFLFFSLLSAELARLRHRFALAPLHEVQPVNEITRSNLWHQIPNENMIIAANAEYWARRTGVPRDRRRGQVGTMILSFASNSSFRTTQNRSYYRTKNLTTQTRSYVLQPSSFMKVVLSMLPKIFLCRIIDLN